MRPKAEYDKLNCQNHPPIYGNAEFYHAINQGSISKKGCYKAIIKTNITIYKLNPGSSHR